MSTLPLPFIAPAMFPTCACRFPQPVKAAALIGAYSLGLPTEAAGESGFVRCVYLCAVAADRRAEGQAPAIISDFGGTGVGNRGQHIGDQRKSHLRILGRMIHVVLSNDRVLGGLLPLTPGTFFFLPHSQSFASK